ncbi:MAG TPA: secretion protein HlyD [Candidatus Caccousia stercoris]|uniref:Secretion protein HlyD n=1 Tax=Candidatus Caccousia stercoris TaxID=2840723 RepID=A0A9D1K2L5_9FIRM|nr:secretion protein HlyD [Candidatus Caccousia stercoris]
MNSPLIRRLAAFCVAFLLLFYIGYQVYNANYTSVKTEVAVYVQADDPGTAEIVQATGTAVRKESVIQQQTNGVITYVVEDGGKVSKGGTVAELYATEQDAAAQKQIETLNLQISQLQRLSSPGSTYAVDQDSLTKQISQKLIALLQTSASGEYDSLDEPREDLLYVLNERQIVTNKVANFNDRIASLTQQRDALTANRQVLGTITAPSAGTFISEVDGYESVFDYSSILTITPEQYQEKLQTQVSPPADAVGKICGEFKWYFVCVVSAEDAMKFIEGNAVSLSFPFATSGSVTAVVRAVNQESIESQAAVVLECSTMNEELARLRTETCAVSVTEYSGIRVSQKAVHFAEVTRTVENEDGEETTETREVKGVYVMHGSEIVFRQIVPLYSTSTYVICDPNPDPEELMTSETVQLYDEIVVEGTDLYDGKVVK